MFCTYKKTLIFQHKKKSPVKDKIMYIARNSEIAKTPQFEVIKTDRQVGAYCGLCLYGVIYFLQMTI